MKSCYVNLSGRLQYVSALRENSEMLPVKFEVPHGSLQGHLLFIIYILNDIYRCTELGTFIFADETNIFVAGECKTKVYEIANKVLEMIYRYMSCNLLHIKLKWGPHIKYPNSKLKCEIGKLYKMKGCIPIELHATYTTHYLSHI